MLATHEGSTPKFETRSHSEQPSPRKPACYNSPTRSIETGAFLFQAGDTRATIYRVVSGAFCHYMNWDDGRHDVIEFAFPGDIIGFGHLETHISSAQAMVPSEVCVVSARDFQMALDQDAQLTARLTAAADREFDVLRQRSIRIVNGDMEHRVAAFLLALSAAAMTEGRDPCVISDSLTCGAAASLLNVDIEKLASALAALEAKGLIERDGKGLRLIDMEGLEALTQPN